MSNGNFFKKLFESIFNSNDPEAIKKRSLKNIAKNLAKTKFKFYKASTNEAEPNFAKFFYDIYKIISPAQIMFQSMTPNALKAMVLDYSLTSEQKKIIDELSDDSLKEFSRGKQIKDISLKISTSIQELNEGIDLNKITKIDNLYTKFICLKNFCTFDFYFTLKKFDASLRERSFNSNPNFRLTNGTYIAEDLKNFIAIAWTLPFEEDWDDVFKMLKHAKDIEPITVTNWRRIIARLRQIRDKRVIEMIIQLITETPGYREEVKIVDYHIIEEYISSIRKQADSFLDALKTQQTANKVEMLLEQTFGTSNIEPLKYYNEVSSGPFERKGVGSFKYTAPLTYLKFFLVNYSKKELRELSDILLVRAEWTNQQLAKPMSDAYHLLMDISERISVLDGRLAENADLGMRLKTYLPRVDRDREANSIIHMLLNDVNDEAGTLILNAIKFFTTYGRNLKMLLEDFVKPHGEIILNWKEINHFSENKLKQMSIEAYKKIYYLVSLLQNFEIDLELEDDDDNKESEEDDD